MDPKFVTHLLVLALAAAAVGLSEVRGHGGAEDGALERYSAQEQGRIMRTLYALQASLDPRMHRASRSFGKPTFIRFGKRSESAPAARAGHFASQGDKQEEAASSA